MNRITVDFLGRNTWSLMDGDHCTAEMLADNTHKYRNSIRVMRHGKAVMPPLSYRLRWQTGARFSTGIKYGTTIPLGVFWTVQEAEQAAAQMVERLLYT